MLNGDKLVAVADKLFDLKVAQRETAAYARAGIPTYQPRKR